MDIDSTTLTSRSNRLREGNYISIEVESRVGFLPHPSLQFDDKTDYAEVQLQTSDRSSNIGSSKKFVLPLSHNSISYV